MEEYVVFACAFIPFKSILEGICTPSALNIPFNSVAS